ncbi:MAG: DUF1622 domain-containing protein [Planctomycetaceae bacterium]|nr:DUF1622 domain-containing protein [Planctomycetaceae bacterium]MCP4464689.1 DUF1622 domain-containing protein [Planctomycetaceae bacterium]MDG1807322.1 DUF1622 domain-containing protein [Pirellulaceae bacterium]MDG2104636.1 DUF1622 domain-containing protein [Pirellulaceae bacterium]
MDIEVFRSGVEQVGLAIDGGGVLIIVLGILLAAGRALWRPSTALGRYRQFRQDLGRGILLGLEFLVAADIIRTVAVAPTLESVLVLGLIVLIRTFLSFALQLEVDGHLPWQRPQATESAENK